MLRYIMQNVFIREMVRVQRLNAKRNKGTAGKKSSDCETQLGDIKTSANIKIIDSDDPEYLPLPQYPKKPNESLEIKKQRLLYQSRKRGMLENDLLLSTFAAKYLKDLNAELAEQYDRLINDVTNDWDLYYYATEAKPTPLIYDNEIMRMLKEHVKNIEQESRLRQPNL